MLTQAFVPILGGSAYRNRGVEPLLDAVVDFLPSPGDLPASESRPAADPQAPLAALAFKVVSDGHAGMVFVRVYRGRLRRGDTVLNAATGRVERVSRLYEVHADDRVDVEEAQAGDIVAIVGLKDTLTGHTLCDRANPVHLEEISVPEPVIDVAIEPTDAPGGIPQRLVGIVTGPTSLTLSESSCLAREGRRSQAARGKGMYRCVTARAR